MARKSTAKILTPFGTYRTPETQADMIEALEVALKQAKRGELVAVAIAGVRPNDRGFTSWRSGGASTFTLLGVVALLNDDMLSGNRD